MTKMQALDVPSGAFNTVARFVHSLTYDEIPADVAQFARLLLLDLIGVTIAGTRVEAGRIARDHAVRHWAAGPGAPASRLMFDGRRASLPGAAFALATQLDNLDAHDGWQPSKGHAGAALLPALVAFCEARPAMTGREGITALVIGYEVAYRVARALHATTADYHTSGAWNALGAAAIGSRLLGLPLEKTRHALGIAEYHAPRSQMMREIANPSMLHDGTGWGAPAGVYAVLVAEDGFTGAPAALVEFDDAAFTWADLGQRWITTEQYIKPYPVCRWAHAAIDGALDLRRRHGFTDQHIEKVVIRTFRYSAELWNEVPASSAVAQYALAWPVAAALVRGVVGVEEILESSFSDPAIRRLVSLTEVMVDPHCEEAYPERRIGGVTVYLSSGSIHDSGLREASGGPMPLATLADVTAKFRRFAQPVIGHDRTAAIEAAVLATGEPASDFKALLDLLMQPPG